MQVFSIAFGYDRYGAAKPKHIGENYYNLRSAVEQDFFAKQLQKMNGYLMRMPRTDDDEPVNIVSICRQGRHRSVAESRLFAEVFREIGFEVLGPWHLSEDTWWSGQCSTCYHCKANCPWKPEVFTYASSLW